MTRFAPALALLLAGCPGSGADEPRIDDFAAPYAGPELLADVTEASGIDFVNGLVFTGSYPLAEMVGSGVAVFDANGDGRLDLYFANAGDGAPNRLYLRGPDGRYSDATESSGLGDTGYGTGVAVADVDNDGDQDVYVGNWGADALYLNDGAGRFRDVTAAAGIAGDGLTSSVAFLDYDLDGYLDVFVVHYVVHDPQRVCGGARGGRDYCEPGAYSPDPDTLYRNRGDGTFEDVSVASGVAEKASSGLGVIVLDFDDDGRPDIYVANDQRANHLWISQEDGTFHDAAMSMGMALSGTATPEASMGVDLGDVDGDGELDVFVTNLAGETNTLYRADRGVYRDDTARAQLAQPSQGFTAFGTFFFDLEHDGFLDIAIANGGVRAASDYPGVAAAPPWDRYAQPNQLMRNDGHGKFVDVSAGTGSFFRTVLLSRGLATADLDADGDLDLVVTNIGGPARVFENVAPKRGKWLAVRALDPLLRRDAVGALVRVRAGGRVFVRPVVAGSSYLSCTSPVVHFGLGPVDGVDAVEVVWPGGRSESFSVDGLDRVVTVTRGAGTR